MPQVFCSSVSVLSLCVDSLIQAPQISTDFFHIGQAVDVCPPLIAFVARNLMPNLVCLKSNLFIGEFVRSAVGAITRIPEVFLLLPFC
jgi:hypothetical protein